jgi:hypothetical protein
MDHSTQTIVEFADALTYEHLTPACIREARKTPGRLNRLRVWRFRQPARPHRAQVCGVHKRTRLRGVLGLARTLSQRLGTPGYLCVDDAVMEKRFAKLSAWAAWTYAFGREAHSLWLPYRPAVLDQRSDRVWRIPVALRLWRPQRSCAPGRYQKKTELVEAMLRELVAAGCPAA